MKNPANMTQNEIEDTILNKELQALNQWSAGNPAGYINNYANDATYYDDIASFVRLDSLPEIADYFRSLKGKIPQHSYRIIDPKVQVYNEIAILTLSYHATTNDGKALPPWKATSVYRLINADWKIVHAHWSLIKENKT